MRPLALLAAALVFAAAAVAPPAAAQPAPVPPASVPTADTTALVRLDLVDGTTLVGAVVRESAEALEFRTTGGVVVTVRPDQIAARRPFEGAVRNGRVVRYDPNRTRLLFSPTARSIPRGTGYLAVYEVFLPFVAYVFPVPA